MIATTLSCDAEDVGVSCLADFRVRQHDDGVVPGEVAEPRPAGLRSCTGRGRVVKPRSLSAPAQAVAVPPIARNAVAATLRLVCALDRCAAREARELEA